MQLLKKCAAGLVVLLGVVLVSAVVAPRTVGGAPNGVEHPVAFTLMSFVKSQGPPNTFTVPTTQRLVIEYASGACSPSTIASGEAIQIGAVQVTATTAGVTNSHGLNVPINPILYNPNLSSLQERVQLGHMVKIYADPGTDVTLSAVAGSCQMTFSGVPISPPSCPLSRSHIVEAAKAPGPPMGSKNEVCRLCSPFFASSPLWVLN
jgi:hypothetical protein